MASPTRVKEKERSIDELDATGKTGKTGWLLAPPAKGLPAFNLVAWASTE